MSQAVRQTHLEFYREHQITPVHYDLSNMTAHLERRFSLYAKLGLLPLSFKGARVLEVAAGTGHNSLFVAHLLPAHLTLLEPNEVAMEQICQTYKSFDRPHTAPQLISAMVEEYYPQTGFDIVLCENWLGRSKHELTLLNKISGMVIEQGMLVLTTISPIGFVPNLLRRFIASYLAPMNKSFQERTALLTAAFGSHLATLTAMTRSKTDWVQDNMINPAYFGLCLSIPLLLEHLGGRFEAIGASPAFSEDWRWFKSLHGEERDFNRQFLSEYWGKAHNFLDHRELPQRGDSGLNKKLEEVALQMVEAVAVHENAQLAQEDASCAAAEVLSLLDDFIRLTPRGLTAALCGLREFRRLMASPSAITVAAVESLSDFGGLFGRETVYVSLIRMK